MLCKNFDGGFGVSPGAESHAGQSKNKLIWYSFFICSKLILFYFVE
jgi:prenyltransferase beta subunit